MSCLATFCDANATSRIFYIVELLGPSPCVHYCLGTLVLLCKPVCNFLAACLLNLQIIYQEIPTSKKHEGHQNPGGFYF